jgi:hypothetical protein
MNPLQAQELRQLAEKFSEGWHDGIKIDASDVMLLLNVAAALAHQAEPVAWHFQSFEDWWDKHGFNGAFAAGQMDAKPLAKLAWEVAREKTAKQAEPVAIPGAIPMSEIAARSRAMPERAAALERARERLKQAEPVAWVDERAISWLDRRASAHITTRLSAAKSLERPMALYTTPQQAEPVLCANCSRDAEAQAHAADIVNKWHAEKQAEPAADSGNPSF